jgi:hypothetical protein
MHGIRPLIVERKATTCGRAARELDGDESLRTCCCHTIAHTLATIAQNEKGLRIRKPLLNLVAGAIFELATFGL